MRMKAVFVIYVLAITAGLGYFLTLGLRHA
jgi:hypothetical protein